MKMNSSLISLALVILAVSTAITATPLKNETAITPSTSSSTTQGVIDINTTITLNTTSTPPPHFDWDIAGHLLAQRNLTIEQSFEAKEKMEQEQEQEQANVRRCRRFPLSKSGHCSVEIALTGTNLTAETVALWTARLHRFSLNQLANDDSADDDDDDQSSSLQEEEGSLHKVFKFLACLRQNSNNLVKGADARLKSCVQWIDALRRVKRQ